MVGEHPDANGGKKSGQGLVSAGMNQEIRYVWTPDGPVGVVLTHPDGPGPFPVILMFHDGPGLRDANWTNARRLAINGYCVVMPDRYHRFGDFKSVDPAIMKGAPADDPNVLEFRRIFGGTTDEHVRTDVEAVLAWLPSVAAAKSGPMGVIGYCVGARAVVRTMDEHNGLTAAGACLHPSRCATDEADSPHLSVAGLSGRIYVGIGHEDKMQSIEMNQPFLDAVVDAGGSVDLFVGADHGFAVPGIAYHDASADQAYRQVLALFADRLT